MLLHDVNVCHHHLVIERKMYVGDCFSLNCTSSAKGDFLEQCLPGLGVCVRHGSPCLQCNISVSFEGLLFVGVSFDSL